MSLMPESINYLGMPLCSGNKSSQWFNPLFQKVESCIKGWRNNNIFQAGRPYMIQSVSNTMANYIMNCYAIPKGVMKKINFDQAKFWWGEDNNKLCRLINWKSIYTSQSSRRLGIRDLTTMNSALLAKLAWRVLTVPDSLLSQINYQYKMWQNGLQYWYLQQERTF